MNIHHHLKQIQRLHLDLRDAQNLLVEESTGVLTWLVRTSLACGLHKAVCGAKKPASAWLVADWDPVDQDAPRLKGRLWLSYAGPDPALIIFGKTCLTNTPGPHKKEMSSFLGLLELETGLSIDDLDNLALAHLRHWDNYGQTANLVVLDIPSLGQ